MGLHSRASMGPRSFDRGKLSRCSLGTPAAFWLQWGRGLSTAERIKLRPIDDRIIVLQWGRGLSTAESRSGKRLLTHSDPLQWGRGLSTAESAWGGTGTLFLVRLQWGRGLSTAESSGVGDDQAPVVYGFNGAAVFRPRKAMD